MKTRWYKNAVIYQIYPRSFADSNGDGIGDIKGIITKIDYLSDLGIDCIWLSPCYKSPNDDNGYDISDYRDIMDDFGTLDDWKNMLSVLHSKGIRLVMDLVVNHSSDEHGWFKKSCASKDNAYRDYYFWRDGKGKNGEKPPNNWLSNFVGSAWKYDERTEQYYLHLFSKKQPDLNWDNAKVRQEVADICNFWLDLGVDGFRCDVITYISKNEGLNNGKPNILCGKEHYVLGENWDKYINEINEKSWSNYDTLIVGECALTKYDDICHITDETKGLLDTSFSFEHMMCDIIGKPNWKKIKTIWRKYQQIPKQCWTSSYLENHDQPRSIPRFAPSGEWRKKSAKMLATLYFFHRGTPYIYQGQEIGMTNCNFERCDYKDIMSVNILKAVKPFGLAPLAHKILKKKARDHARTPMQWNGANNAGFTDGTPWMCINSNYNEINAEKDILSEDSVYKYYQQLIKLRKDNIDIISNGVYTDYYHNSNKVYLYTHAFNGKTLYVQINLTTKKQLIELPDCVKTAIDKTLIISNDNASKNNIDNTLPPLTAQCYLITNNKNAK